MPDALKTPPRRQAQRDNRANAMRGFIAPSHHTWLSQRFDETVSYRWVEQEDAHGCGVAALAMLLNRTYAQIRPYFFHVAKVGIPDRGMCRLSGDARLRRRPETQADPKRGNMAAQPFASAHLCSAQTSPRTSHWVIWLADGTVLDPLSAIP